MKEMYRTKNGSVHLSDGEVNLAILNATDPKEPGHQPGLYHFGFHVEDNQEIPDAFKRSIPTALQKNARLLMPRGVARTRTEAFSISPPSAGVTSGEWISSVVSQKSLDSRGGLLSGFERGGTGARGHRNEMVPPGPNRRKPHSRGRGGGHQATGQLTTGGRHAPLEASKEALGTPH
jgi:hypothetical protein